MTSATCACRIGYQSDSKGDKTMTTKTTTEAKSMLVAKPWEMTESEIQAEIKEASDCVRAADRARIRARTDKNREWARDWEDRSTDALSYFRLLAAPIKKSKGEILADAAPDLLAALRDLLHDADIDHEGKSPCIHNCSCPREKARRALAKAEGKQ